MDLKTKKSDYTWIIDPLDGTSNYAARIPLFGVLVALTHKDHPILSGAYLPISDELYLAEKGNSMLFIPQRFCGIGNGGTDRLVAYR
jgi:myo-inositol-1(or 4)-monophosphatase